MPAGVLALIMALVMLLLLPFLLADAMVSALLELGIAPRMATAPRKKFPNSRRNFGNPK